MAFIALRRVSALCALFVVLALGIPGTTAAGAATFAYDAEPNARVDSPESESADARMAPLGEPREWSATTPVEPRGTSTTFLTRNNATEAAPALARQLAGEEASSIFTSSGGLQQSVIDASREIIPGTDLSNGQLIKALTADGSSIADWASTARRPLTAPPGLSRFTST